MEILSVGERTKKQLEIKYRTQEQIQERVSEYSGSPAIPESGKQRQKSQNLRPAWMTQKNPGV